MNKQEIINYIECIHCEDLYSEKCPACPFCAPDPIKDRFLSDPKNLLIEIERGETNVDIVNLSGRSFLSWEVTTSNLKYISRLLELGADPNLPDFEGRTPFYYAVIERTIDPLCLKILVENGGIPDSNGFAGGSIRNWTARQRRGPLSRFLITNELIDELEEIAENRKLSQITKPAKQ